MEKIKFEGFDKPGLSSGSHSLKAGLAFAAPNVSETNFESPELKIFVAGPRFIFSPAEIHAVFPPRDSFGEFDNVLPHIELQPSALPWQRKTGYDEEDAKTPMPWLALILLQEDEWKDGSKVVIENQEWVTFRDEAGLEKEPSDQPDNNEKPFPPVRILKFDLNFLQQILPEDIEELKWLSHVRIGHDQEGKDVERAVLVCNRVPRPGARAAVHLVSLEGIFNRNPKEKFSLLSIYSWEFTCADTDQYKVSTKAINRLGDPLKSRVSGLFPDVEPSPRDILYRGKQDFVGALIDKGFKPAEEVLQIHKLMAVCHIQTETFKGLMDALDLQWIHIPEPADVNKEAKEFFDIGSVPLAHGLRQGGKTVSWYRGPLIADKDKVADGTSATLTEQIESTLLATLPIRNADQLLMYNPETGMLDVSYASAWSIGRLISISQPEISQKIAQWKTSHAREVALAEQNLLFSHIPFTDSDFVHKEVGLIEDKLQQYFTNLSLLRGLPFNYLVPHDSYLPDESLRFFYIDPLWVECLLDGAFSIGRTTKYDQKRERNEQGLSFPHQSKRPVMTGVLLRSDLVSGWPSLLVEAYRYKEKGQQKDKEKLPMLRFERLGHSVLIVIFEGEMNELSLHLPPESLHFGFNRITTEEVKDEDPPYYQSLKEAAAEAEAPFYKELKSLENIPAKDIKIGEELISEYEYDGKKVEENVIAVIPWKEDTGEDLRVIDVSTMLENINDSLDEEEVANCTHAGHLAIQLLEGVPRLEVRVQ